MVHNFISVDKNSDFNLFFCLSFHFLRVILIKKRYFFFSMALDALELGQSVLNLNFFRFCSVSPLAFDETKSKFALNLVFDGKTRKRKKTKNVLVVFKFKFEFSFCCRFHFSFSRTKARTLVILSINLRNRING